VARPENRGIYQRSPASENIEGPNTSRTNRIAQDTDNRDANEEKGLSVHLRRERLDITVKLSAPLCAGTDGYDVPNRVGW